MTLVTARESSPADGDASSTFGATLKRYRITAGLSQEALAERASLSARAISAYERGVRARPYRDTVRQLAVALSLSPEDRALFEAIVSRRRGRRPSVVHRYDAIGGPDANRPGQRHNLPMHATALVGRDREVADLRQLLIDDARLVTLTGVGGCGKTRLALGVASSLIDSFEGGIRLVELAALADPLLVPQAVAWVFGVRRAQIDR